MTVAIQDAVEIAAFGLLKTDSQHSTKSYATAAAALVSELPQKAQAPQRALQGLTSTVTQGR